MTSTIGRAIQRSRWVAGNSHRTVSAAGDAGEEVGVVRELDGVLEGEASSAPLIAGNHQRGDLDDLTFASRRGPGVLPGAGDVAMGRDAVTAIGGHHGEQGVLDGVGHGGTLRPEADPRLTSH